VHALTVALDLEGRRVVVVGGGERAIAKARIVAQCAPNFTWISESFDVDPDEVAPDATVMRRTPQDADFTDAMLVVIGYGRGREADEDHWATVARRSGALVNVVDRPAVSDLSFTAFVDRSPIVAAVFSQGAAPVVARWARGRVEQALPASLGELATFVSQRRVRVRKTLGGVDAARRFWDQALSGAIGAYVLAGRADDADAMLEEALARGAPPGQCVVMWSETTNPDDISLGAHRALNSADYVVFEPEAQPMLEFARRDAERRARSNLSARSLSALRDRVDRSENCVVVIAGPGAGVRARWTADQLMTVGVVATVSPQLNPSFKPPAPKF